MAVQRCMIPISFQYKDADGDLIPVPNGTPINIINRDTSNSAVVYAAESGSTTIASPQTDAGGSIPGWLLQGSYLFSTAANAGADPPYAGATIAWESVRGDGVENYYPSSIDTTALVAAVAQALVPAGTLLPSAASAPPAGYLLCDGTAVSRTTYAALFAVTSTAYGTGNGTTTFNLPDFRGRTIVGAGAGAGLTNRALGAKAGEEAHALSGGENGPHSHGGVTGDENQGHGHSPQFGGEFLTDNPGGNDLYWNGDLTPGTKHIYRQAMSAELSFHNHNISVDGSGTAHNNMQPYAVANIFVKT